MTDRAASAQEQKVAIVTGAGRGIDREVARGLAQDGWALVLVSRSAGPLRQVERELEALPAGGARHSAHAIDVSNAQQVQAAVAATQEQYGRVDLLVNSAGTCTPGTLEVPVHDFERELQVNLVGPFLFMQAVVPLMKAQGAGHIINIASRAGLVGVAGEGVYGASKFGLVGLSAAVYRELAQAGIRVTAICPAWTNTEMAQRAGTPLADEEMIQPADILRTIRWLMSLSPAARVREVLIECARSIH